MKLFVKVIVLLVAVHQTATAQRYAYVDTQYILDKMPEYENAQKEIDKMAEGWVKEVEDQFEQVADKRKAYETEKILLPEPIRKQRIKEINTAETKAKEIQKQRFGVGGDLFTQRQQLIQPIQDQIFTTIQTIASDRNLAFVFDKANQSNLLYADPKYDISDAVIRKMGIKVNKSQQKKEK